MQKNHVKCSNSHSNLHTYNI